MSSQFVCKVDGRVFSSKEELVEHLLEMHTMEDSSSGGTSTVILQSLQQAFPFASITIQELKKDDPYGDFQVSMNWKSLTDADFCFYIGECKEISYYHTHFKTLEAAISFYTVFLDSKDSVISEMKQHYAVQDVSIIQMYEGDYNSSPGILFEFTIGGKEYGEHFYLGSDPSAYANGFKSHFDTLLEGEVSIERDYSSGSDVEFWIENAPVSRMFQRAKRIRLEILEEREKDS